MGESIVLVTVVSAVVAAGVPSRLVAGVVSTVTGDWVTAADRLLLDAKPPKGADREGGHGRHFDWSILQGFDPAGVCARNLTECLAIQLKDRNRFDPAMQALVGRLDLLAKRDLAGLRRICAVGDEDLTEMIAEIRALNPKPGLDRKSTRLNSSH